MATITVPLMGHNCIKIVFDSIDDELLVVYDVILYFHHCPILISKSGKVQLNIMAFTSRILG